MSQKDNYHLIFYSKVVNGKKYNYCESSLPANVTLSFISFIGKFDCAAFIQDLNACIIAQSNVDDGFISDSVEDRNIIYNYPNVNIDNELTMSMSDLMELLQEWLVFINQ